MLADRWLSFYIKAEVFREFGSSSPEWALPLALSYQITNEKVISPKNFLNIFAQSLIWIKRPIKSGQQTWAGNFFFNESHLHFVLEYTGS